MYQQAPDDQKLQEILKSSKTIAIVGVSDKSDRPSYGVAEWLIKNSHLDVYLINPHVAELFGRKVYPSLEALPVAPDIVDVFRNIADAPAILEAALKVKAKVFWLQLGLEDEEVAISAQAAGVISIQNRCTKIEYARLMH
jgi:predicted CoA-binding protein